MKRSQIILICILLLAGGKITGEDIEITVLNKNSKPLPYAYLLINGKPVEVTDTLGIAIIRDNLISVNDTLSVSYLGALPVRVIYDKSLQRSKKLRFCLEGDDLMRNETLLNYRNFEKLFRQNIISLPEINYNCTMNAKFYARVIQPGHSDPVYGTFEAYNDFKFLPKKYGWFDRSLKFAANKNTAPEFSYALTSNTHMALYFINRSLAVCRHGTGRYIKSFYSYLGEKGNSRVFRIVFSQGNTVKYYYQIIIYADKETKYIQSVNVEAVTKEPGSSNLYKFSTLFECGLYTHKKPAMNTIYIPENVYYSYQMADNLQFDIMMSDVSVKYRKFYR